MSDKPSRKSKGRQRVEMVKIANESNLQVTFSKRRNGLFKKASELCTLCGVDIAIIVFSPGKKVFSFGHPCVELVLDRFLNENPTQLSGTMQLLEAHRNANIRELNMQLTQVLDQLEVEKKRGKELNQMRKASQAQCWWEAPVEELNLPQLEQLKMSLEVLKKNVRNQAEKVMIQSSNPQQFFAGSSSSAGGINLPFGAHNGGINLPFDAPNGGINLPFDAPNGGINPPFDAPNGGINLPFDAPNGGNNLPFDAPNGGINLPFDAPNGGINLPFDAQNGTAGFNPNVMPHHGYNPGFGHGFY